MTIHTFLIWKNTQYFLSQIKISAWNFDVITIFICNFKNFIKKGWFINYIKGWIVHLLLINKKLRREKHKLFILFKRVNFNYSMYFRQVKVNFQQIIPFQLHKDLILIKNYFLLTVYIFYLYLISSTSYLTFILVPISLAICSFLFKSCNSFFFTYWISIFLACSA